MRLASERVTATTNTLAKHADAVLDSMELVLARVADEMERQSWDKVRAAPDLHQFLEDMRSGLPQVESIFVIDRHGQLAATSRSFPAPVFDAREREYFKGAQEQKGIFVSAPFRGQSNTGSAFVLSRAFIRDGGFDGVLGVRVFPAYFDAFYEAVLQRPGASAAALIRHTDGAVLLRYPEVAGSPQKLPPSSPLMQAAAGGAEHGIYTGVSSIDGRQRLAGFVRLQRFPLLVNYTMDRSVILGAWYSHVAIFAFFAVLAGLALFLTARLTLARATQEKYSLHLLVEETERRQQAEAKLQQSQKLEALGRLTGGVAHDFNNLLAAILGGIELSSKHVDHPRAVRLLGMAREAAQRGAKLTSHMLAFARKQDVALQTVDTNTLLEEMNELLDRTIGGLVRVL
jgi:two-component system NtrC family sensor kinase